MADAIVGDGTPVDNSLSSLLNTTPNSSAPRYSGVVQHPQVTPDVQVKILAIVDEAAGAELEDIIAALGGHPQPVAAVLALVDAGVLELERGRILDGHSRISRRNSSEGPVPVLAAPGPVAGGDIRVLPPVAVEFALPDGITAVPGAPHTPAVFLIDGVDVSKPMPSGSCVAPASTPRSGAIAVTSA